MGNREKSKKLALGTVTRPDGQQTEVRGPFLARSRGECAALPRGHADMTGAGGLDVQKHGQVILEHMPAGAAYCRFIQRLDGRKDYVHLAVNGRFTEISGLSSDKVLRRPMLDVLPTLDRTNPEIFEHCTEVAVNGGAKRFESWLPALGRWFEFSACGLEPDHFLLIFTDITEQRRNAAEVLRLTDLLHIRMSEQAQQLASGIQDMEAFLYASVTHLQDALDEVHLQLESLGNEIKPQSNGAVRLVHAGQSAQRMGDVLTGALTYIRGNAVSIETDLVELTAMIQNQFDMLYEHYPRTILHLAKLPMITGAPAMLKIIFKNLLENACKFSSNQARPEIYVGVRPQAEAGSDMATVFFVRDNGVGFNQAHADQLFTPYDRLHPDNAYPGAGVGLALVKRLIERQGGTIWAESRVNGGSTFFMTLGPLPTQMI